MADRIDYRYVDRDVLFNLKQQAIELWQNGISPADICKKTGLNMHIVNGAIRTFQKAGLEGLKPRPHGAGVLSGKQELEVLRAVIDHNPSDYGEKETFWMRNTLTDLCERLTGEPPTSKGYMDILRRWQIGTVRPWGYERENVDLLWINWMSQDYPTLEKRIEREQAAAVWVSNYEVNNYYYGDPVKYTILQTLERNGIRRFRLDSGKPDAAQILDFLAAVKNSVHRPRIYLMLENANRVLGEHVCRLIAESDDLFTVIEARN